MGWGEKQGEELDQGETPLLSWSLKKAGLGNGEPHLTQLALQL